MADHFGPRAAKGPEQIAVFVLGRREDPAVGGDEVHGQEVVGHAFRTMASRRADAVYIVGDSFTVLHANQIVELVERARLPAARGGEQRELPGGR